MNSHIVSFPKIGLEFNVNPVAFSIGENFHVYWYGIIIAIGFILALLYAFANTKKFGLDADRVIDVILVATIAGFIGARLYYVIFSWDDFKDNLWSIFDVRSGGLAIYGGVIAAFLVGFLMCKIRKISAFAMGDLAAMGFLIGQGIGRWGNFVNIEAFGSNTNLPWGMTSPVIQNYLSAHAAELSAYGVTVDPSVPVHPCFLYESIWCLLGFLVLHLYKNHRKFDGEILLMYIGWYGLGRFVIEGLRTDSLMLGNLRVSQIFAILCVIAAVITILVIRSKIKHNNDENYLPLYVNTELSKQQILESEERNSSSKKKSKKADTTIEETAVSEDHVTTKETDSDDTLVEDVLMADAIDNIKDEVSDSEDIKQESTEDQTNNNSEDND